MNLIRPNNPSRNGHFTLLFAYMMAEFAIIPIFEDSMILGVLSDLVYLLLIFYVVYSIRRNWLFGVNVLLFIMTITSDLVLMFNPESQLAMVILNFITCAFVISVIVSIVPFLLQNDSITLDGVLGGLCAYILIGGAFNTLYINVELLQPGSFNFGVHGEHPNLVQLYDLLFYYSFISLLTIGFGDILPMSHTAQALTVLEGVIGLFYVVFFISLLVGMHISARLSRGGQAGP